MNTKSFQWSNSRFTSLKKKRFNNILMICTGTSHDCISMYPNKLSRHQLDGATITTCLSLHTPTGVGSQRGRYFCCTLGNHLNIPAFIFLRNWNIDRNTDLCSHSLEVHDLHISFTYYGLNQESVTFRRYIQLNSNTVT